MNNIEVTQRDIEKTLDFVLQKRINGMKDDVKEIKNKMEGVNATLNRLDKETTVNATEILNLKKQFQNYLVIAGVVLSGVAILINLIFSIMK